MSNALFVIELVESLCASGKSQQAEEVLEPALVLHPDEGRLWKTFALVRYHRGDFGTAASAFEHAGLLVPLSAEEQIALGDCYARTERRRHARNSYRHVLDDPTCPTSLLAGIAAGLGRIGDHRSALDACRLAARRQPDHAEPLFGTVFYMRKLGFSAKAVIPLMEQAVELAPNRNLYRHTLAFLLSEDGRTEDAYDLIRDSAPAEVGCACQIRRMMSIFQAVGDFDRWTQCRQQLDDLR